LIGNAAADKNAGKDLRPLMMITLAVYNVL